MDRTREPFWLLVFIGSMAVDVGVSLSVLRTHRSNGAEDARATGAGESPPPPNRVGPHEPVDLARASPRELRRLPGVGEIRALAIARERWARRHAGVRLELDDLPGIGPVTAARIRRAAMSSESFETDGSKAGRPAGPNGNRDGTLP